MKLLLGSLLAIFGTSAFAGQYEIDALASIPYVRQQAAAQIQDPKLFSIQSFKTEGANPICADFGQSYTFSSANTNEIGKAVTMNLWLSYENNQCIWRTTSKLSEVVNLNSASLDDAIAQGRILASSAIVAKIRTSLSPAQFVLDSVDLIAGGSSLSNDLAPNPSYEIVGHIGNETSRYYYDAVTGLPRANP